MNNKLPMIKQNLSNNDLFFNSYAKLKGLDANLNALLLNQDSELVQSVKNTTAELRRLAMSLNSFCKLLEDHLLKLEDLVGESEMLKC